MQGLNLGLLHCRQILYRLSYTVAVFIENGMEVPLKTKNKIIIWSCKSTPGYKSGENHNLKRYVHPNVTAELFNSQDIKAIFIHPESPSTEHQTDSQHQGWLQQNEPTFMSASRKLHRALGFDLNLTLAQLYKFHPHFVFLLFNFLCWSSYS